MAEDLWHQPVAVDDRRGMWWVEKIGYRKPLKGEYYLSGAVPQAYRAPADLLAAYLVVKPVRVASKQTTWT